MTTVEPSLADCNASGALCCPRCSPGKYARYSARHRRDDEPREVYSHLVDLSQPGFRAGKPVVSLCGKVWVPNQSGTVSVGRCPDCEEIAQGWWTK